MLVFCLFAVSPSHTLQNSSDNHTLNSLPLYLSHSLPAPEPGVYHSSSSIFSFFFFYTIPCTCVSSLYTVETPSIRVTPLGNRHTKQNKTHDAAVVQASPLAASTRQPAAWKVISFQRRLSVMEALWGLDADEAPRAKRSSSLHYCLFPCSNGSKDINKGIASFFKFCDHNKTINLHTYLRHLQIFQSSLSGQPTWKPHSKGPQWAARLEAYVLHSRLPSDVITKFFPFCLIYSFSWSCPKTVLRTREVFPTGSTTLLRLQLWCTRDCAHRSRHVNCVYPRSAGQ